MTRWLTVREVATRLGIDTSLVSRYCQEGRLRAEKPGRDWLIDPASVDVFEAGRRRPGRPPTPPRTWEVLVNNGAGSDETRIASFGSEAEAKASIEREHGNLEVVGADDEHGKLWGAFLCPEGCAEHSDDGHPFVFVLPRVPAPPSGA